MRFGVTGGAAAGGGVVYIGVGKPDAGYKSITATITSSTPKLVINGKGSITSARYHKTQASPTRLVFRAVEGVRNGMAIIVHLDSRKLPLSEKATACVTVTVTAPGFAPNTKRRCNPNVSY
jgi:hypothetical protein